MNEELDFALEDRQLCSDGACIGVIGEDGLCKECGRAAGDNHSPETDVDPPSEVFVESPEDESPISADDRVPCPDGTCIGIIGPDGSCGTCGQTSV